MVDNYSLVNPCSIPGDGHRFEFTKGPVDGLIGLIFDTVDHLCLCLVVHSVLELTELLIYGERLLEGCIVPFGLIARQ